MRLISRNDTSLTVELTDDEVAAVAQALNEVLNGPEAIEQWEFQTRMGVEREDARQLLAALIALRD